MNKFGRRGARLAANEARTFALHLQAKRLSLLGFLCCD